MKAGLHFNNICYRKQAVITWIQLAPISGLVINVSLTDKEGWCKVSLYSLEVPSPAQGYGNYPEPQQHWDISKFCLQTKVSVQTQCPRQKTLVIWYLWSLTPL